MKNIHYLIFLFITFLLFYGCDSLEKEDVVPESFQKVQLSKSHFRTVANNKLVLDFLSKDNIGQDAVITIEDPSFGTLSSGLVNSYFVYDPNSSFIGKDSIPYKVCIGNECASSVVTIHVDDPDQVPCPTAIDDFVSTVKDIEIKIPITHNDSICSNSTFSVLENPKNGTAAIDNNSIVYQPKANFFGNDIFKYEICSGIDCANAMVFITIFEKDTAQICDTVILQAFDDKYELALHDSIRNNTTTHYIDVFTNDILECINPDNLTLEILEKPVKGEAFITYNNTIKYTTLKKGALTDKIKYKVCMDDDDLNLCHWAWLNINFQ